MSSKFGKSRNLSGKANWGISGPNMRELKAIMLHLDAMDLPALESALYWAGDHVAAEARGRHPAPIADSFYFEGIKGVGIGMKAIVKARHPGARTYEYGRSYYYKRATELATTSSRGKKKWFGQKIGNNRPGYVRPKGSMKGQQRFKSPRGFHPPQPILGVLHMYDKSYAPGAIQAVGPAINDKLRAAIMEEFENKVAQIG